MLEGDLKSLMMSLHPIAIHEVNYNSKKPAQTCRVNSTNIKLYLRLDSQDIFFINTFSFLYGASDT